MLQLHRSSNHAEIYLIPAVYLMRYFADERSIGEDRDDADSAVARVKFTALSFNFLWLGIQLAWVVPVGANCEIDSH